VFTQAYAGRQRGEGGRANARKERMGCLEESQAHRRHEVVANTQEAKECKKNKEWSGGLLVNQGCERATETVSLRLQI
jgi:hypothetical protein